MLQKNHAILSRLKNVQPDGFEKRRLLNCYVIPTFSFFQNYQLKQFCNNEYEKVECAMGVAFADSGSKTRSAGHLA